MFGHLIIHYTHILFQDMVVTNFFFASASTPNTKHTLPIKYLFLFNIFNGFLLKKF